MNEIKSTLDLVLEKTKHLTLSKDDKKRQELEDAQKAVKGLVQKYIDQVLTPDRFSEESQSLSKIFNINVNRLICEEIIANLSIEGNNEALLVLLHNYSGTNSDVLNAVIKKARDDIQAESIKRTTLLKEALKKKHAISGSAVIPNLEKDIPSIRAFNAIRENFHRELKGLTIESIQEP